MADDPCRSEDRYFERFVATMPSTLISCSTDFSVNRNEGTGPELGGYGDRLEIVASNAGKTIFRGSFIPGSLSWRAKVVKSNGCSAVWFQSRTAGSQCCTCSYYFVPGVCGIKVERITMD